MVVLVIAGHLGGRIVGLRFGIPNLAGLSVKGIDAAFEQIVGNAVDIAAIGQPLAARADVVGCALALHFDEERKRDEVLAVPRFEGAEELNAFIGGAHRHIDLFVGRQDAAGHFLDEALLRQLFALGFGELDILTGAASQRSGERIKGDVAFCSHSHDDFG